MDNIDVLCDIPALSAEVLVIPPIAPKEEVAVVASSAGVLDLVIYSYVDFDPSEDPSSEHAPIVPSTFPLLSSNYFETSRDYSNNDSVERPPSPDSHAAAVARWRSKVTLRPSSSESSSSPSTPVLPFIPVEAAIAPLTAYVPPTIVFFDKQDQSSPERRTWFYESFVSKEFEQSSCCKRPPRNIEALSAEVPVIPPIAPKAEAAVVASSAGLLDLVIYSYVDFDPSEDPSSEHAPIVPSTFPLLSFDYLRHLEIILTMIQLRDHHHLIHMRPMLLDGGVQQQGSRRFEIQLVPLVKVQVNLHERLPKNPAQLAHLQVVSLLTCLPPSFQ
nr:hypothetical protein [Tanacetum cinerariifolium]